MHTFDNAVVATEGLSLEEVAKNDIPDCHEVGETDDYWVYVRRSHGKLEIVSKISGSTIAVCPLEVAHKYGISKGQVDAARGVLKL